jgi:hypothetical protein
MGLLAAAGAAMSSLVRLTHGDLVSVNLAGVPPLFGSDLPLWVGRSPASGGRYDRISDLPGVSLLWIRHGG